MKVNIASPAHKKRIVDFIESLPYDPQWTVECKLFKLRKTQQQVNTIHMWFKEVRDAFQDMGKMYTFDGIKHYFKDMFGIMIERETPSGMKYEMKSLADYKIDEMSEFMDKCYHHAVTDLHIFVTLPGFDD